MPPEIVVALIAASGSVVGTVIGILSSNKLTLYRIGQLEKKMDEHNAVIKRTFVLEEKISVANNRIDDLEDWQKQH